MDKVEFKPSHVIAIDGSCISVSLKEGYPGAEVGYVTIASVILKLDLLRKLDTMRPIDPVQFRKTEEAESLDAVFPGCNIVVDNEVSARSSFRRTLYELLRDTRLFEEGESLLETYEVLLADKPLDTPSKRQSCPYSNMYEDDCDAQEQIYQRGQGEYGCNCFSSRPLYSTDALRIHERMRPDSTNSGIFTETMQVLERLWLIHILRGFEKLGYLQLLKSCAFMLDGPLAIFGQPAWLSQSIKKELQRINSVAHPHTDNHDLLIIGIEKSGTFVSHLEQLANTKMIEEEAIRDRSFLDIASRIRDNSLIYPQMAFLLTDSYIKQNIIYSESVRSYGRQTYFGRKFFYRTKSGAYIVASLPFLREADDDLTYAEPKQFPRLADAMALFDQLVSSKYPNSLSPIVAAHSEAAIPLNLGKKVLEKLARDLMQE
ncbi:MAG: DNA double-strand break repair nuclease NurA [Ardenticatenaceae bacterium]|nr:DNA double-strand break repair nuclease NurA [Ardenticatenaceae bacterium]